MSAISAIQVRPRSALALFAASVVGVMGFGWPLLDSRLAGRSAATAHAADAPWLFIGLLALLLAVVLAEVSEHGIDAKAVAVLGVLAGCGAALRPLSGGATGFSFVFFLLIPAGRVLGRNFGFVLGAVTLLASALLTGQVGRLRAVVSSWRSWPPTARSPACSTACFSTCRSGRSRATCRRRSRSYPVDRSVSTSCIGSASTSPRRSASTSRARSATRLSSLRSARRCSPPCAGSRAEPPSMPPASFPVILT
jgi:hypothetical protein